MSVSRDIAASEAVIDLRGPWFTCKQAAAYIPCKTVKAFYEWRKRHGLIARANGTVAKADIDRILRRRKPRRVMAAASLANLQRRSHAAESAAAQPVSHFNSLAMEIR